MCVCACVYACVCWGVARDGCGVWLFASLVCVVYCVCWGVVLSDLGILEVGIT